MAEQQNERLKIYEQLCNSYRAIDDFRAKLLALLPLATGGGIILLVGGQDQGKIRAIEQYLPAIGLFGFVVTLGLYFFELHGILKCTHLIKAGTKLEKNLGIIEEEGQFIKRPLGILYFINEPFASGIIYPAILSAWFYIAFELKSSPDLSSICLDQAIHMPSFWVFVFGFLIALFLNLILNRNGLKEKLGIIRNWLNKRIRSK